MSGVLVPRYLDMLLLSRHLVEWSDPGSSDTLGIRLSGSISSASLSSVRFRRSVQGVSDVGN